MRTRLGALAAATLAALATALVAPSPAQADHSWAGYHWARTSNPFTLQLGDNLTSAWDSYLRETSVDWNASRVLDTAVVAGSTTGKRCRASAGRVEVCNASYGRTGWLGVASISARGGHITSSTVKLNDTYFSMPQYNSPEERLLVTCQEIGHAFGLDHQDDNFDNANLGTCMDYGNDPTGNERPNAHDFEQLETIYGHLDSTTTVAASAARAGASDAQAGTTPAAWGRAVAGSLAQGHSTYVRDVGAGQQIVTFVTWAR